MYRPETVKCFRCGYDTGLNTNGFLMVIPPEGLVCPYCGNIISQGRKHDLLKRSPIKSNTRIMIYTDKGRVVHYWGHDKKWSISQHKYITPNITTKMIKDYVRQNILR